MKLFAESPTVLCTCKCIKQHLQRFSVTRESSFMHVLCSIVPGLYSFIYCRNSHSIVRRMFEDDIAWRYSSSHNAKKMAIICGVRSCCSLEVVKFVATMFLDRPRQLCLFIPKLSEDTKRSKSKCLSFWTSRNLLFLKAFLGHHQGRKLTRMRPSLRGEKEIRILHLFFETGAFNSKLSGDDDDDYYSCSI